MRANTNLTLRDRSTLTLGGFTGLDVTSAPTEVSPERATDAVNMIYENGSIRKRKGWRQKQDVSTFHDWVYRDTIRSFYSYRNGNYQEILIQIGGYLLYHEGAVGTGEHSAYYIGTTPAQFFQKDGKCYIVTGVEYLVYGSWDEGKTYELKKVSDVAYVPTTTTGIGYKELVAKETEDGQKIAVWEEVGKPELWEATNLLTRRRKNLLNGSQLVSDRWTLDAAIEKNSIVDINIEEIVGTNINSIFYQNDFKTYEPAVGESATSDERVYLNEQTEGELEQGAYRGKILNWGKDASDTNILIGAQIMLNYAFPSNKGYPNITVEFNAASLSDEDPADKIRGCTFGVLFGVNGGSDRLFLSGNPKYPNTVFYSASDDFTYFCDNQYFSVGDESAAITGFVRVADGTLAVLKEESDRDAAIFYVTGTQQSFFDSKGNLEKTYAIFTVSNGGAGEGNLHPYATANLAGDGLLLSRNGGFAIVPNQSGSTNVRHVKERSYSINRRLLDEDLSGAVGMVYNNRYYLSVGGHCYVADAGHKYYRSGNDMDQSFNYEWWYWENVPATSWSVIDGVLWFGTADGRLCAFDTEEFFDTTEHSMQFGEITWDGGDRTKLIYGWSVQDHICEGDWIRLLPECGMLAVIAEAIAPVEDTVSWYVTDEETCDRLREGMQLIAGNYDAGQHLTDKTPVMVTDVDRGACRFRLDRVPDAGAYDTGTNEGSFCLFFELHNRPLLIVDVDEKTQSFSLKETQSGEILRLSIEGNGLMDGCFYHHNPIEARWITPYFDMGNVLYGKTLLRLSVTAKEGSGRFLFGYETKGTAASYAMQGIESFTWENFSFERLSFANTFASSYTLRAKSRNFNLIRFCFRSDTAEDMLPGTLTALYKINKMNRGVR